MNGNFQMRLCGKNVNVIESDPGDWAENSMGMAYTKKAQILLCSAMPDDVKAETLLHEVIHFVARDNGLSFKNNEQDVSTLSIQLFAWMRDNPDIVGRIARGGQ